MIAPETENNLLYKEISQFVEAQANVATDSSQIVLDEIPYEVQKLVNDELKGKTRLNRTKMDILTNRAYHVELEWKLNQLNEIMKLVGDVPKYSIGNELSKSINDDNLISKGGVSLRSLMKDVYKLPELALRDDVNIDDHDYQLLEEYNNIRTSLIRNCSIIEIAEEQAAEIATDVERITSLLHSIEEKVGHANLIEYFQNYHDSLLDELNDLVFSLEDALKSGNLTGEKKEHIRAILSDLQGQEREVN
ncbi:hypothetical protein KAFR_0E03690 [Kazachstania africana CBS 2517]|uniref:Uncharacterized protein n=1 Tax=Kazachstania africana (strain ATCC 22294 / BCRC 22015 / CBS 2517 / CECT 1963 / NBRC 1671 / NRRL Y-8276) TaxID=1071382 RepID=H2AVX0_KAZAF|nr:hypothetical protein KAFR_0E03690 [Kazachstania africana CBS 2517]CCF58520.1 hypothetical protein KAFR_0E03690 [Kazachstania africana CBS 2517]